MTFLAQSSPPPEGNSERKACDRRESALIGSLPFIALLVVWGVVVLVVNPIGEFMVNDDWSFIKALETLLFLGKPAATGWGPHGAPGGPSLITHLLWGMLFTYFGGFSITVLRLSVIAAGVIGSLSLLALLRVCGASRRTAFIGALTLVANPLFLSQSFTYMTDVTFTSAAILSILCLSLAVKRNGGYLLVIGLLLSLCSILTRQIGVVIPAAFLLTCILHEDGGRLGRGKLMLLVLGLVILPWMAFEYTLFAMGSTPLTEHQVVRRIITRPFTKGLEAYLIGLGGDAPAALAYVGFLVSPVCALRLDELRRSRAFVSFFVILTVGFVVCEGAVIGGYFDPPVGFFRNVIVDFGIGPILLKDTYILGIQRLPSIPKPLFCLLVYWAALSAGALVLFAARIIARTLKLGRSESREQADFPTIFPLAAAIMYTGIILLSGFHDRYLIPVCMLGIVALVADMPRQNDSKVLSGNQVPVIVPLVLILSFSVAAVHDFMAMKRSQKAAQDYLTNELHADPCRVDGGFEFNGYHCYSQDYVETPNLSWWWIKGEDYLITLGPLPGYRVVKLFPFSRLMGPRGAIHVLQPRAKPLLR